jgi:hypothetical protein
VAPRAYLSPLIIVLPTLLEDAWARALPGREAASQNELLRAYQEFVEPATR